MYLEFFFASTIFRFELTFSWQPLLYNNTLGLISPGKFKTYKAYAHATSPK